LASACRDDYRVVRIRAAAALSNFPPGAIPIADHTAFKKALEEYMTSLDATPDHWTSPYNLGNFYLAQGDTAAAAAAFETAAELEPQVLPPYLNASVAYARLGRNDAAEAALKKALAVAPDNPSVHVNLGMLLAEEGRLQEAESVFRAALKHDPKSAVAAYNLCVLLAAKHPDEALRWAKSAYHNDASPKYGYNLAFFLQRNGQVAEAITVLKTILHDHPDFTDATFLLAALLEKQGKPAEALAIYRKALQGADPLLRRRLEANIRRFESQRKN
jgi:tetratricopeptide (TPR) repeat protein